MEVNLNVDLALSQIEVRHWLNQFNATREPALVLQAGPTQKIQSYRK